MSNLPLDDKLKQLFDDITNGRSEEPPPRAILAQNDNGIIRLMNSASAQGSDRDDFNDVLGQLFKGEPNKPGYALYRLDSKSPAGLYEWINCAFRPEGAKVREKMQYTITQASLFKGLNEQHFLETVYGATAHEFSFPSRLRNARKHDYQNPQLSTKGKSAADAAGTDAGGKRRNFEALSAASSSEVLTQSTHAPTKLVATMPEVVNNVQAKPVSPPEEQPQPKSEQISAPATKEFTEPIKNEEPSPIKTNEETKASKIDAIETPIEQKSSEETGKEVSAESVEQPSIKEELSEKASTPVIDVEESKEVNSVSEKPAVPVSEPVSQDATARIPDSQKEELPEPTEIQEPVKEEERKISPTLPTTTATQATSSIGLGRGAEGLETERERELAKLKQDESQTRASGSAQQGTGGPKTGFAWDSNVEGALEKLSGGSKVANLVVLKLDLSKEEVQLAGEPESVEPSGLAKAISSKNGTSEEPNYVFYAHPELQSSETQEGQIALIYICPTNSTVRQRMLYSVNLAILSNRVNEIEGIKIVKRTETSDVEDLTPDFLADALSLNGNDGSQQNGVNSFIRPKRPGRR